MVSVVLPRFHRQRFLLQFIALAGGKISKIDLQKLLFLAHRRTQVSYFDFVPYYCGTYSFQAASDLELLEKTGWVKTTNNDIELQQSVNRLNFAKEDEKVEICKFLLEYKELRGNDLIKYVYERYPYYTINSKTTDQMAPPPPSRAKKNGDGETLYTIGYEGMSFETYVNKLIRNGVNVICDVRKNPLSRKFGFSKGVMSKLLPRLKIKYIHIPELGIVSSERKDLSVPSDYAKLFKAYNKTLPSKAEYIANIQELVIDKKVVALTCFEHGAEFCHRNHIGGYMKEKYLLNIKHL